MRLAIFLKGRISLKKYDLVVVGGGFAGCGAAISAARQGLNVLLIEQGNALGGAAVNCLVNPFMPYWTKKDGERYDLSEGLFAEICSELEKLNLNAICGNIFNEEYLKICLNRMLLSAGAELLFHSFLSDVQISDNTVSSVEVTSKSGKFNICADYFIDATGDADLAKLAGFPFRLGRETDNLCQPMTLCFRVAGVDLGLFSEERNNINKLYKEFKADGKIKNHREDVLIFGTLIDGVLHFNSTRIVKLNPTNTLDVTKAEIEAREQVFELFTFLHDNFKSFKNSTLLSSAASIGIRESRMIDGEYILTGDDLKNCVQFEDSIALGNYDIDIHNPEGSGTSHYYFPDGEYYTIPYRSLIPKGAKNLLVAGRCISTDHYAQASIRIMPIVCCLGEAAGCAASVAYKDKCSVGNIDIKKLQDILKANNAKF